MKTGIRDKAQGIGVSFTTACAALLVAGAMVGVAVFAQQIQLGQGNTQPRGKEHVLLLSDSLDVPAGTPQTVELRFRVDPGFHINSHKPKDELLIPTVLKMDAANTVRVSDEQYPAGVSFKLQLGEGETLDVYQNEFRVGMRVVVPKGQSTLTGALRYQACDSSSCFPPRLLPVKVAVTGK